MSLFKIFEGRCGITLSPFLAILKPSSYTIIKLCLGLLDQLSFQCYVNQTHITSKQFDDGIE